MQRFARCAVYVMTKITQINFTPPIALKPEREEDHKSTHNLKQYAPIVVISCGTTLVIISGQIDLGAGSVVALSGCISVSTYLHTHSLALAILAGLCVGVLTGLINGFVITHYKLAPFIVTLAMQFMARFGGPFPPILRFEKLEILRSRWRRRSLTDAAMPLRVHKVYLRFPNLDLTKNLSPNQLAESCGVA